MILDGEHIETTPHHPFYTQEKGWLNAGDLTMGMHIRKADGSYGLVWWTWNVERSQLMYNLTVDAAHTYFVGTGQWLVHNIDITCPPGEGPEGLVGHDFEDWLVKKHGGSGSQMVDGREFDNIAGDHWMQAKSGKYWEKFNFQDFRSDMGAYKKIAENYGGTLELHSNSPIPPDVQNWLSSKAIEFFEYLP